MRGSDLTVVVAMRELGRLLDVYTPPKQHTGDVEALARRYVTLCAGASAEQFTQAVTAYLQSPAQWFPKPGQLRALAQEQPAVVGHIGPQTLAEQYHAWERAGWADERTGVFLPCPVCGSAVESHGRVRVLHDPQRHRETGVPYIGRDPEEDARVHRGRAGTPGGARAASLSPGTTAPPSAVGNTDPAGALARARGQDPAVDRTLEPELAAEFEERRAAARAVLRGMIAQQLRAPEPAA